jgi:hypothetical protein
MNYLNMKTKPKIKVLESITDSIKDTVKSVKDNTVDKVTNTND